MDQATADPEVGGLAAERTAVLAAREQLGRDIGRLDAEVRTQVAGGVQKIVWKLGAAGAAFAAATAVRKLMAVAWKGAKKTDPPSDPASEDVSWSDAVMWTAATAVGIGVAKLVAARGAAVGWKKATGERPPS